MAESSGIRAGKAFVEFFLQDRDFTRGLDRAGRKLRDFGQSITDIGKKTLLLGSAITAPLLVAAQRFGAMGEEMAKASEKTGVGVEALSALKYAAEQTGVGFDQLESGMAKMQKTLFAAAGGSDEARKALAGIGLTIEDLKGLSPDQQFQKISDGLAGISDATARTGEAMAIFGKSGAELLPLLNQGGAAIAAMQRHAESLGIVMSKDDAEAGKKFEQSLKDVWAQLQAITFQIGAAVATALQPFASIVTGVLRKVIDWAKENRFLVITLLAAGAALITVGAGLVGIGTAIKLIGFSLSGIASGFKFVTAALGLLANPIVLIGALLIGLVAYFVYASGNGGKLLAWLGDRFALLERTAKTAFGGIADALAAGDISLAAQILWTALQLMWLQGTKELQTKWIDFKAGFVKVAAAAFFGVQEIWANVKANLENAWSDTVAFFGDLWDGFIGTFTNAWNVAVGTVTKGINDLHHLWDSKFDAKSANAAIDNKNITADQQHQKQEMARQAQREADRKKAIADVEKERQQTIDDLNRREQGLSGGADANAEKDKKDLEKKKQDLDRQLQEMRNRASKERRENGDAGGPPLVDPKKLADLDDVVGKRANTDVKSQGIFNLAALQTLQSSPTQEALKKAAESTAKNTKKIADNLPNFTFSA